MDTTHVNAFVCGAGMKALALMPCCWPRRREFARANSDELRELAHLMCLKASSLDTYAAWAQHLWGTLVTAAAKAAAESGNPTGEMAIGVHRDPNILSEKNLLLTALKTGSRGCRSTASAQKRYVASARAGTWYRYAALREVYGMSIEHPLVDAGGGGGGGGPGGRPRPRLKGNVKPLHSLRSSQELSNSSSHDSSRRGRKRRRQQTAADDAIILDHLVSRPPLLMACLLWVLAATMQIQQAQFRFDPLVYAQASFGVLDL